MAVYKLPEYKQHPVAMALMPGGMDDKEFEAFKEDCVQRGIIMPATVHEGMVLDGWHRYRVAASTGMELKFIEYKGDDPAGYIASVNVHRRKLSSLQRALVGARLHRDHGLTQREACKKLAISNEVITLVLKAIDSRNTKLIKRIEDDSDFTRGMLKEELEDAGLLRAKPKAEPEMPAAPASVFSPAYLSSAACSVGLDAPDPEDDDEEVDELLETGKGLKKDKKRDKAPKVSAAQLLQEQYEALMEDEKITFLQMIWPTAGKLVDKHKIDAAVGRVSKSRAKLKEAA